MHFLKAHLSKEHELFFVVAFSTHILRYAWGARDGKREGNRVALIAATS